mgnify:CR=1 FL=1
MEENAGIEYEDFKSEKYKPSFIESIMSAIGFSGYNQYKRTAHEEIDKLIESLPNEKFTKLARVGASPSSHGDFIDIYRILNPDSTINIQPVSASSKFDANLSRDDRRELNSQISLENLIKQLEKNPNKPSMTKNELSETIGSYGTFPVNKYYLE